MTVFESREERLAGFRDLEDGWFGPGSEAPKDFIIDAVEEAFALLDFGVIGHWAFGPHDGGIVFEYRKTFMDENLEEIVTQDTDVAVYPTGENTYEVSVEVDEFMFDSEVFEKNRTNTTKQSPYKDLWHTSLTVEGTVDSIVQALNRKLITAD